jgi:hypothetical protein
VDHLEEPFKSILAFDITKLPADYGTQKSDAQGPEPQACTKPAMREAAASQVKPNPC